MKTIEQNKQKMLEKSDWTDPAFYFGRMGGGSTAAGQSLCSRKSRAPLFTRLKDVIPYLFNHNILFIGRSGCFDRGDGRMLKLGEVGKRNNLTTEGGAV